MPHNRSTAAVTSSLSRACPDSVFIDDAPFCAESERLAGNDLT